ncbi:MAG: hypothetical protein ABI647_10445 [Gemmatimonadota bacterium]
MFIELTDHLRCTRPHDEQFLVLLPGEMRGRLVWSGELGCPVCGRVVRVEDGVADFGGGTPADASTALAPEAIQALLGIQGPGGYVALIGSATTAAPGLAALLPGVRFVLVNPARNTPDSEAGSVVRAGVLPVKRASMRGVVVGSDAAADPRWVGSALGAALGGLRVVAEGEPPGRDDCEVLAAAPGVWVGKRR